MPWCHGQELTLTFHTFISSISCQHLPTFRSQASIVSEKATVFNSLEKPELPHLTMPKNRPIGSSFEQYMMDWSTKCYISSVHRFRRRRCFERFLPYMGLADVLVMGVMYSYHLRKKVTSDLHPTYSLSI